MNQTQLKREDFSYEANSRGYMLKYKGQSIGGTGISSHAIGNTDIEKDKQTKEFVKSVKIDIHNIIFGHPGRYGKQIDEINKEM